MRKGKRGSGVMLHADEKRGPTHDLHRIDNELSLDDLVSYRIANQFADGMQLQLAHYVGSMGFSRFNTDI